MKTRFLIIIGVVLMIAITSTFILNYYIDEEIKAQKFSDEQIDRIFKRCDYQKIMDERNWIGFDGNKITDHQPMFIWNNSTHHLDNNICKWITIEKYESDANLKDALERCWIGNSEFLDDDFVLWSNETHYIDTDTCLITEIIPEPEPEPMSETETLQKQKQQEEKLHVQKIIMTDYRGHEYQIKAINEYRTEFEEGYFLEQFIQSNKQNYEKDDLINFIVAEWGYQPKECTSPKVEAYFRSYENYDKIEKISEWQKPKDSCSSISSDPDGYLIMNLWHMPGIFEPHETCTIPGEYRVVVSNLEDESKVEWGYFTCQKEKLVGEPQPWMELPK